MLFRVPFQVLATGIEVTGQEIPEINIKGTEVKTKIKKGVSRSLHKKERVMAKKIQAAR